MEDLNQNPVRIQVTVEAQSVPRDMFISATESPMTQDVAPILDFLSLNPMIQQLIEVHIMVLESRIKTES